MTTARGNPVDLSLSASGKRGNDRKREKERKILLRRSFKNCADHCVWVLFFSSSAQLASALLLPAGKKTPSCEADVCQSLGSFVVAQQILAIVSRARVR